jgi:chromosome segregation ATPase
MERKVTDIEIEAAALRLLSQGRGANANSVRAELGGRGSNSTIQKSLEALFKRLSTFGADKMPPSLPEELHPAIEMLWNKAALLAGESYATLRDAARDEVERAKQAQEQAEAGLASERAQREAAQGQVSQLASELTQARETIARLEERVDQVERQRKQDALAADQAQKELTARYDREIAREARERQSAQDAQVKAERELAREIQRGKEQREALDRTVSEKVERITVLERDLGAAQEELRSQGAEHRSREAQWRQETDSVRAKMAVLFEASREKDEQLVRAASRAERLERDLARANALAERAEGKRRELEQQLAAERKQLALVERSVNELNKTVDGLRRAMAEQNMRAKDTGEGDTRK